MNILIGDISSYKAITVSNFIHNNYPNIKIYSFDSRKFTKYLHTKYVYKNILIEEDNIESYKAAIVKYDIDFFIPVINNSLKDFWKNKEMFKSAFSYLGSFEAFCILNDKMKLHELSQKLGVNVPKRYESVESAQYPFVVKPTNLSSSKGVIYVEKDSDIPVIINLNNIIIQQFIEGEGVGYSFYCKNGKILNAYGHRRLAEYPITGGSSTYRAEYIDERMHNLADSIVSHLNYSGFAMFEFKLTKSSELYLLEVNPRIWGSINQGLSNGVNYFEGIFGKADRLDIRERKKVKTYIGPLVYLSLLGYLFKLKLEPIYVFIKNALINKPDVHLIKDPGGYLSTILRKVLNQ